MIKPLFHFLFNFKYIFFFFLIPCAYGNFSCCSLLKTSEFSEDVASNPLTTSYRSKGSQTRKNELFKLKKLLSIEKCIQSAKERTPVHFFIPSGIAHLGPTQF